MSIQAASSQPTLSFPPATFAKLSPHPYLLAHLKPSSTSQSSIRTNGRTPTESRIPHVNTTSLTHAEGSAVVRVGDTTVVCGVRGEILAASDIPNHRISTDLGTEKKNGDNEAKELDLLVPNIELATGCSPSFLPGQPPSTLAQSLSTRVYSLLHSSHLIDSEQLRIYYTPEPLPKRSSNVDEDEDMEEEDEEPVTEVKGYWTLYIDLMFISLDGNAFDVAWAAVVAALRDTRLPHAYWDADQEMILCSDEISKSKKVTLSGLPIASTYIVFSEKTQAGGSAMQGKDARRGKGYWILADPDTFEEGLCDETVTVTLDCKDGKGKTKVLGISKSGGGVVGLSEMKELASLAEERWRQWAGVKAVDE